MSYKRILIWEPNWIGDVIFTTPFIRAVRNRYPDAFIACVTVPRCKELLEVNPNINEVLIYDEKTINKGLDKKMEIVYEMRKRKFDLAILLHRSFTRALLCMLGGIKHRLGYSYRKRNIILTNRLSGKPFAFHRVEYFMNLAKKVGADPEFSGLEFYVTPEDEAHADEFLRTNGISSHDKIVALNPGGNWEPKRWPPENYAKLAEGLMKRFGVKIIVTGQGKDVDLYLAIQDRMEEKVISSCGQTTIRQLGALFRRYALVISGDSGPLHVALAMKRRTIALFGPTSPDITGPYGNGDHAVLRGLSGCDVPCYIVGCKDKRCMDAITVDDVMKAASKMLGG